jgi:hypothetical protein
MHKRIKQLALQAEIYAGEQIDEGADYNQYPRYYTEKFAELIVEECISTLEEKIYRSIDNEGDEIWADLILKEHFGVEE